MKIQMKTDKAFTLAEIVIVIGALGLLTAVTAVSSHIKVREKARSNVCQVNRGLVERSEAQYFYEIGKHTENLQNLVDSAYLKRVPKCPSSGIYSWVPAASDSAQYQSQMGCSIHNAQTDTPASSISDNFNDGNSNGWANIGYYWSVKDGKFYGGVANNLNGGENRTFLQSDLGSNYTMEVDAKLISGTSGYGYGIYFRAQDYAQNNTLDAYVFQYDPGWNGGSFVFRKVVNGAESNPIAQVQAPAGYQWTGTEKHITLAVSGNTYKAYVSDINGGTTPALQLTDSTYSSGTIGLRTWNNSYASFDNVTVTKK